MGTLFVDKNRWTGMQFKDTAQIATKTRPERFRDILINIIKLKLFTEILLPERASHSEAVTHLKMFRRSPLESFSCTTKLRKRTLVPPLLLDNGKQVKHMKLEISCSENV